MRLFGPIIALMLIEIALFITVGGAIGLLASLAVIFGTGVLGVAVIRRQGRRTATDMRAALNGMRRATGGPGDAALIFLAGGLLVLPGFLADTIGLLLLVPPVRRGITSWIARRMPKVAPRAAAGHRPDVVIDGEFIEVEEIRIAPGDPNRPSGWTKH